MTRALRLSALILVLASPTMPGAIQSAARAQVTAQAQPQMGYQTITSEQAPTWSRDSAQELLTYVQHIGQEGLNPSDYGPDRLRAAIAGNDEAALTQVATPIFIRLVQDLSGGAVRGRARVEWHMTDVTLDHGRAAEAARPGHPRGRRRRGAGCAAADPSAICRAQARARQHAGERHRAPRPHPHQYGAVALDAAYARRAPRAGQRAGIHRRPDRRRSRDRAPPRRGRRGPHADAAAQRADHRGDDQSLVERAAEHHPLAGRPFRRRL